MNRNNTWKWFLLIFVTLFFANELYPPNAKNLVDEFTNRAANVDTNFTSIVNRARELDKKSPERGYLNLVEAIGTNDVRPYFPKIKIANEKNATRIILNSVQQTAAGKIKLGLDLQGGTSFLVAMDTSKLGAETEKSVVLAQAVEVLRKRVDRFGVAEPQIQPVGTDRILIQLPGLSEAEYESAKSTIAKPAFLEFRLVHENSDELVRQGIGEPGYELLREKRVNKDGTESIVPYLVRRRAEKLAGKNVDSAGVFMEPISGKPGIHFTLDAEGAEAFAKITRENVGRQLAIVLDGELYSAPRINGEIPLGKGEITGSFTANEAFELANVLENPLEAPVSIMNEQRVEPTLGKDSIEGGLRSAVIGTIAVALFMAVYYMLAGVVANIALALNIVILIGAMCSVGTTLTLPGIAGIVLTIGMAVDANVLIFERIREELAAGKSLRGAISAGYDRAFGTILDSNITTLIASSLLIVLGSGPIRGFGVALTIGITVSMFTALIGTRVILDWLFDKGMIKSLKMLSIIKGGKINFLKYAKPAFLVSWTLIAVGIGFGLVRGGKAVGVDFAGGDRQTFAFSQKVELEKIRETVVKLGVGEPSIGYQKDLGTGSETLQVTTAVNTADKVKAELLKAFPDAQFVIRASDTVGGVVAQEILKTALISVVLALFGILIYVAMRYEYSFAVAAVVAIIHDILMTLGCYFLSGRELNGPMVAAVLTIIGFSINDTIVIFDRIREDLKLGVRGTFTEIINHALNQTLSRTIITSGTVFIATGSLFIFGGGVINDFAFTFLVGILTGTYSSIYIASPIVIWWHKGERPKAAAQVTLDNSVTAKA
ncbi:MAG: protein translocase subunit SecD [Verrucomicrobia bacterium]|nr:protein translocase subunit SecD [Verrucomicrobiota bacterium]